MRSVRTRALSMQRHVHDSSLTFPLVFPAHDPQDEEKAAKPAEEKKPEPIGPPRGSKVRLSPLRFPNESFSTSSSEGRARIARVRVEGGGERHSAMTKSARRRPAPAADIQTHDRSRRETRGADPNPPRAPRRRTQVKILRPESYWFNDYGKVISVDQVRHRAVPVGYVEK